MSKKRSQHSSTFKAKVALDALKGVHTLSELSSRYKIHPTLIGQWKARLQANASEAFDGTGSGTSKSETEVTTPLYEEIGRLKMEVDWLKKKL